MQPFVEKQESRLLQLENEPLLAQHESSYNSLPQGGAPFNDCSEIVHVNGLLLRFFCNLLLQINEIFSACQTFIKNQGYAQKVKT